MTESWSFGSGSYYDIKVSDSLLFYERFPPIALILPSALKISCLPKIARREVPHPSYFSLGSASVVRFLRDTSVDSSRRNLDNGAT